MVREVAPKLLSWASEIDEGTVEQAARAARLPFVEGHVALMPDAHVGIGATVGSVIPTDGAIIPAAVGVDIGCGMMAVRTQFTAADMAGRNLAVLHEQISRAVPLSAGGRPIPPPAAPCPEQAVQCQPATAHAPG